MGKSGAFQPGFIPEPAPPSLVPMGTFLENSGIEVQTCSNFDFLESLQVFKVVKVLEFLV